jgi:hypothetical protein
VQVALLGVAAIPVIAGTLRLIEVFGGPQLIPHNPRIAASPAPVVVHIIGGGLFLILGAFQFSAHLRAHRPIWHRRAGRALMLLGLSAALAALWMTLFYPRQTGTGEILYLFRLAFGSAMTASIILAFKAIRRRDVMHHRAWMTRAYALALGAGTQAFTIGIGHAVFGKTVLSTDLSTASGWIINLAVAEHVIRSPSRRRAKNRHNHDVLASAGLSRTAHAASRAL